jgi:LuxR family maltose regulon positive regulatory protein
VLILDDLHKLLDPAALDGLARLLRDLTDRLHVVLSGRAEPSVGLHRLRVAGKLTDIRAGELAFRSLEAAGLLAAGGARPTLAEATQLIARTEGWPVGLRLLADARQEQGPPWIDEIPDTIRDYLRREVLNDLPPEIWRFVLGASIPEEICGDLAGALTGDEDSERILESLERSGTFLTRVNGPPGHQWFRFHGMFRDVLRRELDVQTPSAAPELHVLAANWHAEQGYAAQALKHAAAARDWSLVGWLAVEHAIPMTLSEGRAGLIGVLRQIPPEHFADTPELALCAAMLLLISDDYAGVRDQLTRAQAMLAERESPHRLTIELAVQVMHIAVTPRVRGDALTLIAEATRLLETLGTMRLDRFPVLLQYRALALCFKGVGLLWADRVDEADQYLWAASTAARVAGVALVEITALGHLAVLVYLQGSLREAEHHVAAVDEITHRRGLGLTVESTAAHLTRALIELERNRLPEAQQALRQGLHAAGQRPEAALAVVATIAQANLLLIRDEPLAARELLRRCRFELRPATIAPLVGRWLAVAESEADLTLGDTDGVVARYARRDSARVPLPAEQVMLARAYEQKGEYGAAEELLARTREGPDPVSAVTAWVVTALIADAQGNVRRSADALGHAVLRAEGESIRRPFRKFDSHRMTLLAERQRWLYEESGPPSTGVLANVNGEHGFPPLPAMPDTLSERERDVLRYLPTVLTANEIAVDLSISVNTVKAHMRSIYRKLGAGRRREAVIRARQTGLL